MDENIDLSLEDNEKSPPIIFVDENVPRVEEIIIDEDDEVANDNSYTLNGEEEFDDETHRENSTSTTNQHHPPRTRSRNIYDTFFHSLLNRINSRKGCLFTFVWLVRNLILTYALFLAVLFLIIYDISLTLSTFYTIRKNNRNGWWREFNHNHPLIPEFKFTSTIGSVSVLLLWLLLSSSVFHRCIQFLIYFVWSRKQYAYVADIILIKYKFLFPSRFQRDHKCAVLVFKIVVQLFLFLIIEVLPLPIAILVAVIAVVQNQDYKSIVSMSVFFIAVSLLLTNICWFLLGLLDNYIRFFFCCIGHIGKNIQNRDEEDFFEKRVSIVADTIVSPTYPAEEDIRFSEIEEDKDDDNRLDGWNEITTSGASEDNLIRILVYFCWYMTPFGGSNSSFQIRHIWVASFSFIGVCLLFVASMVILLISTSLKEFNHFYITLPLLMFNAWWCWFSLIIALIILSLLCLNSFMNCFIKMPIRDPIRTPRDYTGIKWYEVHKRVVFGVEEIFYHSPRLMTSILKCLILAFVVFFVTIVFFFTPFRGFITRSDVRSYIRLYSDFLIFFVIVLGNLVCILICYQCRYNFPKDLKNVLMRLRSSSNEEVDIEEDDDETNSDIKYKSLEEGGEEMEEFIINDDEQNESLLSSSLSINNEDKEKKRRKKKTSSDAEDNECMFFRYGSIYCLLSSMCCWCCVLYFFIIISWIAIILWSTTGNKGAIGFFFISFNIIAPVLFPILVCLLGWGVCDRHRHFQNVIRYGYFIIFCCLLGGIFFVSGLHDFGQPNNLKAFELKKKYTSILTQPNPITGRGGKDFAEDKYLLCRQDWEGLDIVDMMFLTELSYKICSGDESDGGGACGKAWMTSFFPEFCKDGFVIVPDFEEIYSKNPKERDRAEYEFFFDQYIQLNGTDTCLIRSPRESEDVKFYHIYSSKYKWHVISIRGTKTLLDYIQDFNLWKEIALLQFVNFFIPVLQNFGNRFIRIIVALWDSFNSFISGNFFSLFLKYDENTLYYHKVENYIARNILCRNWHKDPTDGQTNKKKCIKSEVDSGEESLFILGHSLGGGLAKIVSMSMVYNYNIGDNINEKNGHGQEFFTPIKRVVPFSFAGPGIVITSGKFFFMNFVFDYFLKSRTGVFEEKMDADIINIKPEVDVVSSIDFLAGNIQRVGCPTQNVLGCHSSSTILQTLINSCGNKRSGRDIPFEKID